MRVYILDIFTCACVCVCVIAEINNNNKAIMISNMIMILAAIVVIIISDSNSNFDNFDPYNNECCIETEIDVDCEALPEIENGRVVLVDGRTTYNASVEYSCAENYTLVGPSKRVCSQKALWFPEQPKCLCKLFYTDSHRFLTCFCSYLPPP